MNYLKKVRVLKLLLLKIIIKNTFSKMISIEEAQLLRIRT